MKKTHILLAVAALLLAGCASTPTASPTTTPAPVNDYTAPPNSTPTPGQSTQPEPSGPGTYYVGIKDAAVLMEVPTMAGPDAETLAVLELAGVKPGSWIKADIDNRKGQEPAVLNVVGLSTAEGKRIEYKSLPVVSGAVPTSGMDPEVQRRFALWSNAQRASAEAGERADVWLMSAEPVPEFVRVDAASGTMGPAIPAAKQ